MSEEITATVTFGLPTLLVGRRWFNRLNPVRRVIRSMLVVVVLAALVACFTRSSPEINGWLMYVSPAVVAGWLIGTLFERLIFVSGVKSSPLFGQQIVYKASEPGLGITSPVSTSTLAWNALFKSVGTPDGALLYQQKRIFNWLPKSAFTSEADYNRFLDLLAAKTKHTKLG